MSVCTSLFGEAVKSKLAVSSFTQLVVYEQAADVLTAEVNLGMSFTGAALLPTTFGRTSAERASEDGTLSHPTTHPTVITGTKHPRRRDTR